MVSGIPKNEEKIGMSKSGAIRVMSAEYFLNSFIHLRGRDVIMFGDGTTKVIFLRNSITLKS